MEVSNVSLNQPVVLEKKPDEVSDEIKTSNKFVENTAKVMLGLACLGATAAAGVLIARGVSKASLVRQLEKLVKSDGQLLFDKKSIDIMLKNCKSEPRYLAKIKAVISNPEELSFIETFKTPGYGIWRAIRDPLKSTVDSAPRLFKECRLELK